MHFLGRIPSTFVLASLVLAAAAGVGCVNPKVELATSKSESGDASKKYTFEDLSSKEQMDYAETLVGEVQNVYASDTGLARVFGQAANLGPDEFKAVRFEIRAETGKEESDEGARRVVGFVVAESLAPGDIEPFDVQTTAAMGDVENLRLVAVAVAR